MTSDAAIELRGVAKAYGTVRAVAGVDLDVVLVLEVPEGWDVDDIAALTLL